MLGNMLKPKHHVLDYSDKPTNELYVVVIASNPSAKKMCICLTCIHLLNDASKFVSVLVPPLKEARLEIDEDPLQSAPPNSNLTHLNKSKTQRLESK